MCEDPDAPSAETASTIRRPPERQWRRAPLRRARSPTPHQTLATEWPKASMPDHMISPMTAAIPITQAIMPARLTIPIRPQDVVDMTRRADAALLPRLLEVKGVGRAQPESPLAGR